MGNGFRERDVDRPDYNWRRREATAQDKDELPCLWPEKSSIRFRVEQYLILIRVISAIFQLISFIN